MAAPLATLDGVTVVRGDLTLLDDVSIGVLDGDRIGVVGRNGAGKSTLVGALAGLEAVDGGRAVVGSSRIGVLQQADPSRRGTVRDLVVSGDPRWEADPLAREVIGGLELRRLLDRDLQSLSGGERRRSELARLLLADLDVLVLDEPTNHLDIPGITWLAGHLVDRPRHRALVVVTHDRWFLDEVCTRTWEVVEGTVNRYDGGYGAWILARAERARQQQVTEQKAAMLARKELAWLRRGAPARTSKPRYRIEAAEALIAREPPPRDTQALRRFATARLGKTVYELDDVTLKAGEHVALSHVTRAAGPGDRIGLLGRNGAGKSTVLSLLAGERRPDGGRLVTGQTVQVSYLSQSLVELDPDLRLIEAVERAAQVLKVGDREWSAGQLAEVFGFPSRRQWTPIGQLSGGERRRLQLLLLLVVGPNVLLLDEPTNDLDLDTLVQLEDLLDGWPGTLIVTSHDRWFLERVTDVVWALDGHGALADVPGGVASWLERLGPVDAGPTSPTSTGARPPADAATVRQAKKDMARIERQLSKSQDAEKALHQQMADSASDHQQLLELDAKLRALLAEREELEAAWLEAADLIDG
ncbi:MAG TPA: ABC-F family ATP-binding cassette domain-containing protein [Mycobacteriales bacterium]|nr:ABC-F family ATP-binding cassette domain-containing protein [Mycobacteriales bacterium]